MPETIGAIRICSNLYLSEHPALVTAGAFLIEDLLPCLRFGLVDRAQHVGRPFGRLEFVGQHFQPVQVPNPQRGFVSLWVEDGPHSQGLPDVAFQNGICIPIVVNPSEVRGLAPDVIGNTPDEWKTNR
ncbi:MAG TPA: hypothetical protein VIY49_39860 [Bryobacteraceae bacterium]